MEHGQLFCSSCIFPRHRLCIKVIAQGNEKRQNSRRQKTIKDVSIRPSFEVRPQFFRLNVCEMAHLAHVFRVPFIPASVASEHLSVPCCSLLILSLRRSYIVSLLQAKTWHYGLSQHAFDCGDNPLLYLSSKINTMEVEKCANCGHSRHQAPYTFKWVAKSPYFLFWSNVHKYWMILMLSSSIVLCFIFWKSLLFVAKLLNN